MDMVQEGFNAGIVGLGVYLPEKRMTEQDFIKAGVPKEYIDMWGVYEHRVSDPDEASSDMSIKAAKNLIEGTGIDPSEIDLIIDCAMVPDYILPGNAQNIQCQIGAVNSVAIDIVPSHGGVVSQLVIARALILSNTYKKILITCSSKYASVADKNDWIVFVAAGDGAAAALISRVEENKGILSSNMISRGEFYSNSGIKMMPQKSYKNKGMLFENYANKMTFFINDVNIEDSQNRVKGSLDEFILNSIPISSKKSLEQLGLSCNDVDFWIMHQNVKALSEYCIDALDIRSKNNYYYSYDKYGCLYNANLLVNLYEAIENSLIKEGDIIVLAGVHVGFSAGSIVMRWGR